MAAILATFGKIGLLFIPTSSHTGRGRRKIERSIRTDTRSKTIQDQTKLANTEERYRNPP